MPSPCPTFLSCRFRDKTKLIETIGALTVIIFFVPYTASGFVACGKLFNSLFGFDYMTAMIVSAAVIVAYCATGGFMAASVTSLIQGFVMTIALIIVLIFGINVAGGWSAVMENAKAIPGYLNFGASTDIITGEASSYGALKILSTLAWGLVTSACPMCCCTSWRQRAKKSSRSAAAWQPSGSSFPCPSPLLSA